MSRTIFLSIIAFLIPVSTASAAPTGDAPADTARVVYLAGELLYLDAGRLDGLAEGQILHVEREGAGIAVVRVEHLASHRASCSIVETAAPPAAGDLVRWTVAAPGAVVPPAIEASPPPEAKPDAAAARRAGLHGRLGGRYLTVRDRSAGEAAFSQPSLDVRLSGESLAGGPLGVQVDARSRRTWRTGRDGETEEDGRTRMYRLSASWRPSGSPFRITAGRQVSPDLASVSLFDGILAERIGARMGFGVFAGTPPDEASFGISTDVVEVGAFTRVESRPGAPTRWSATGGAVASRTGGEPDREFAFLRGQFTAPRLGGYLTQEIDLNRGWKADAGEKAISLTGTHANLRWRPFGGVDLDAGYDDRRRVRLYRDRVTPETEFDDSHRRGVYGGVAFSFRDRFRVGGNARTWGGGSDGGSGSWTITARAGRVSPLRVDLDLRGTSFSSDLSEGRVWAVGAAAPVVREHRIGLRAGRRDEERSGPDATSPGTTWVGGDVDVRLGGGWYLLGSVDVTRGDVERNDQVYTSVSYRF